MWFWNSPTILSQNHNLGITHMANSSRIQSSGVSTDSFSKEEQEDAGKQKMTSEPSKRAETWPCWWLFHHWPCWWLCSNVAEMRGKWSLSDHGFVLSQRIPGWWWKIKVNYKQCELLEGVLKTKWAKIAIKVLKQEDASSIIRLTAIKLQPYEPHWSVELHRRMADDSVDFTLFELITICLLTLNRQLWCYLMFQIP